MKIATWNVNSLNVRLPQVLDWLAANSPDVLCLQETKLTDDNFPARLTSRPPVITCVYAGQKTYNGVAVISRQPAPTSSPTCRVSTIRNAAFWPRPAAISVSLNLYVANGEEVG